MSSAPLLELAHVTVDFQLGSRLLARVRRREVPVLRAVDDVSLTIGKGEAVGLVGESGAGKSTLAQVIVGLLEPTAGSVHLDGVRVGTRRPRHVRRRVQMIFQDPGSSLNPRLSVGQTLAAPLRYHRLCEPDRIRSRCAELLEAVGLPAAVLDQRPSRLSGGQRQRVAIARALAVEPDVLVADEAVAALDVSVQASILALLNRLRDELDLTLIFVSHDLAVVRQISSRVIVFYLGTTVEDRSAESLFGDPQHPYTRALIAAAPRLGVTKAPGTAALAGEAPSAIERPTGCRFRTRCPLAQPVCAEAEPALRGPTPTELAACHFAWSGRGSGLDATHAMQPASKS